MPTCHHILSLCTVIFYATSVCVYISFINSCMQFKDFFSLIISFPFYGQIYFQDFSGSKPVLKLPSTSSSPIIDPHLSPDGTMLAYIRDYELHVLNLLYNEQRQLTYGANGNTVVSLYHQYLYGVELFNRSLLWMFICLSFLFSFFGPVYEGKGGRWV